MKKQKTTLITAGPTIEPIDPVRFISNRSSGKMGYAMARAFSKLGDRVILISGPTQLKKPAGIAAFIEVQTAKDMLRELKNHIEDSDTLVMTAAVADYRLKAPQTRKIKKTTRTLDLELIKNPDILKTLARNKKPHQTFVGFAAETNDFETNAQKKLKSKKLDWIILNPISQQNPAFDVDDNQVTALSQSGKIVRFEKQKKTRLAQRLATLIHSSR